MEADDADDADADADATMPSVFPFPQITNYPLCFPGGLCLFALSLSFSHSDNWVLQLRDTPLDEGLRRPPVAPVPGGMGTLVLLILMLDQISDFRFETLDVFRFLDFISVFMVTATVNYNVSLLVCRLISSPHLW